MQKVAPKSHRALMLFLQTVLVGVQEYADLERPHLHADTVQQVRELLDQYVQIHHIVTRGDARRKTTYQTMRSHTLLLEGQLDALWAGVRAHVRAHQATPDLYGYYGLTQEGTLARPRNRGETIALATEVLSGHEEAQQVGFSVVDISSLADALSTAQATNYTLQQVLKATHDATVQRNALRREARLLYREVSAEMRRALLRYPDVYQRQVMRKYGFVFESDGSESDALQAAAAGQAVDQNPQETGNAAPGGQTDASGPEVVEPEVAEPEVAEAEGTASDEIVSVSPVPHEPNDQPSVATNGAHRSGEM